MHLKLFFVILPMAILPIKVTMAANEFLVTKWKMWFNFLDVNHNGAISTEDVNESMSKFSDLHLLEADEKTMVMDNFEHWWNKYVFRGQNGDVSEQQFVDTMNKELMADKAEFCTNMQKCFNEIFDMIDTNKDRSISEEEFLIAFIANGNENVALVTHFFNAYNPKDGLVHLRYIVDSWVDFDTSNDSSTTSVVKEAFETGV